MKYFQTFPKLLYSTSLGVKNFKLVPNIIAKTKFLDEIKENSDLYYRYSVKDGETAEHIADKVYGNPYRSWILLMANDVVDPQYDWVMDARSFSRYINSKYSSYTFGLDNPENYIPNSFLSGEVVYQGSKIDKSSANATVVSYSFAQRSLTVKFTNEVFAINTVIKGVTSNASNKILTKTINNDGFQWASNTTSHFRVTEVTSNNFDNVKTTRKYTVSAFEYNFATDAVISRNTNTSFSNSYTLIDGTTNTVETTIAPMTYYDYELDLNEEKRSIVIIKPQYISSIENQFRELMRS